MAKVKEIINCNRGYKARQNIGNGYSYLASDCCCKLNVYNWLKDIPGDYGYDIFEVRFKNTHKGFYCNTNKLSLNKGDIVAVETPSGHDVGIISACGPIVLLQMKRRNLKIDKHSLKKIYRKAKGVDIEKWQEAIGQEHRMMISARRIITQLKLNMKIGDVEFQGDGTKATFYYISEDRVDFRELIKILAGEFHIRIDMRQIGARQEAGLIGGIGVCGRELCCAQWISEFVSVNTTAARIQDLSPSPQKMTGQCGKLKCCLNYEVATYADMQKDFPQVRAPLDTMEGAAYLQKTDVLNRIMWFSFDPYNSIELIAVPIERVKKILELNREGKKADYLVKNTGSIIAQEFISAAGEDSITRFDKSKKHAQRHANRQEKIQPKTQEIKTDQKENITQGQPEHHEKKRTNLRRK